MAKIQTPRPIRGTQDMLGDTADRFYHVVETFDRVRRLYGFKRIEVPVIEPTAVFSRSLGETTDVVSKEMYTFEDRGGDSVTLRPEFTAGICRAYLTEGWQQYAPLKVATHGPLFRYERPQKGRYRQFHQIDAEVIGAGEPAADIELLCFADQLLKELGITEGVTLTLNTLGDAASRDAWRAGLVAHFEAHREELSEDSLKRLAVNPMRILDSKDPRDIPIAASAPDIDAYLTGEAQEFFGRVTEGLDAAGVAWERHARLVRGLDYYRHTAFEFVTDRLGAQGTVLGGGRYDGLIETLGGPATPAVGWAAGIERLGMLIEAPLNDAVMFVVIPNDSEADDFPISSSLGRSPNEAWKLVNFLRRGNISADVSLTGKRDRRIERARRMGASAVLFISENPVIKRLYISPKELRGESSSDIDQILRQVFANFVTSQGKSASEFIVDGWQ
jgi:histidyl-tRNA synthetase